mgnify:CR=1 FL=1
MLTWQNTGERDGYQARVAALDGEASALRAEIEALKAQKPIVRVPTAALLIVIERRGLTAQAVGGSRVLLEVTQDSPAQSTGIGWRGGVHDGTQGGRKRGSKRRAKRKILCNHLINQPHGSNLGLLPPGSRTQAYWTSLQIKFYFYSI